jgi:hypothetical protein
MSDCVRCGGERIRYGARQACPQCERVRRQRRRMRLGGASKVAKAWARENREKHIAHRAVERAVKKGKLVRQPCAECGTENSHAHHEDYSRQLEVMWLCPRHHKQRHREMLAPGISAEHLAGHLLAEGATS